MIYANNAGTTWPKPDVVWAAQERAVRQMPGDDPQLLDRATAAAARLIGAADPSRVLLTGSCTDALALGILDHPWSAGDRVLTSHVEHHAVVRPIRQLVARVGVVHEMAPYRPGEPFDLAFAEEVLRGGRVRLVACSMASNVTGELLPVGALAALTRRHGALLLVDAAQTAGLVPVPVDQLGCDLLTFAGHTGPLGPLGVGGLYVRAGLGLDVPVDWGVFSRLWKANEDPEARLRLVRTWLEVVPDEMDLRLRLLALLEETGKLPEARRLALELRGAPLADARERNAVGELWMLQD